MEETTLPKRQENLPRGPPSPRVAGAIPRAKRSVGCISVVSSQGALAIQDTLKETRH